MITTRRRQHTGGTKRSAFTLLEVLFSILVVGILISLLLVGLQAAGVFAKNSADRQAVAAVATGLGQFKERFGFAPPLMKDFATTRAFVETGPGDRLYAVYVPANTTDMEVLRPPPVTPNPNNRNPFADFRFSEYSLAVYLCGAGEISIANAVDLPIDGVKGLGFYTPRRDGSFEVPRDIRAASSGNNPASKRAGAKFDSFISLSSGGLRLEPNLDLTPAGRRFEPPETPLGDSKMPRLVDGNGRPLRYYTWIEGREEPANSGKFVVETIADYNIPALVAFTSTPDIKLPDERDPEKNLALRSARWAIVGAGPNGVFGDESVAILMTAVGSREPGSIVEERQLRAKAAFDNVVEVGQ